jgi:DNA-binding transcriptional LysR family regulator
MELEFISIMGANQWLGVELRHLAALEAVARTRSFGQAARELGYTQSAVSQQIAQLEKIVGQRLFDRPGGPRRVEPTEAGLLLLRHADAIVARIDAAKADMDALSEGAAGTLRVGIYQSVGARLLPALVRRFRAQWPLVGVRVREESDAADLLRLLEHGELDLTFAELPLPPAGAEGDRVFGRASAAPPTTLAAHGPFEWAEVLHDPYVFVVSARSDLAELDSAPPLREIAKLPLIGRRSTDEPERHLAGRVPALDVVFRTDDNGTLQALVAEGLGSAIEPRLVVDPRDRRLKMLPFGSRIPPRTLVVAWHRDRYRSQAAQAFVELAKELATAPD